MKYYVKVERRRDSYDHIVVMEESNHLWDKERGSFKIYNYGDMARKDAEDFIERLEHVDSQEERKDFQNQVEKHQRKIIMSQYKAAHGE